MELLYISHVTTSSLRTRTIYQLYIIPQAHCQAHISYSIIYREREATEWEDRKTGGMKVADFTLKSVLKLSAEFLYSMFPFSIFFQQLITQVPI